MRIQSALVTAMALAAIASSVGCSGGTSDKAARARPGTPAFYWAAANETFKNGDYLKTSDNLSKLGQAAEYKQKAEPWNIILNAGMAQGYMDLAEKFDTGGKANKANAVAFQRRVSYYRSASNTAALQFTEALHHYMEQNKDQELVIAMPAPSGSAAEPANIQRIAKGILPPEAEQTSIERAMMQRGVLLTLARLTGSKDDPAKAVQTLRAGEMKLPRDAFMRAMAHSLFEAAQLYLPNKLDQPKRLQVLCQEATEALSSVKVEKADKELDKKIKDTLKKYKLS